MHERIVGHRLFVDGVVRAVRLDAADKQYVLDGDGQRVADIRILPPEVPSDPPAEEMETPP
jgi:hypothetical protein